MNQYEDFITLFKDLEGLRAKYRTDERNFANYREQNKTSTTTYVSYDNEGNVIWKTVFEPFGEFEEYCIDKKDLVNELLETQKNNNEHKQKLYQSTFELLEYLDGGKNRKFSF